MSRRLANLPIVLMIIFFFLGLAEFANRGPSELSGVLLIASAAVAIIFGGPVSKSINEIYKTRYTKRLPILWGIGILAFGAALLLHLV